MKPVETPALNVDDIVSAAASEEGVIPTEIIEMIDLYAELESTAPGALLISKPFIMPFWTTGS